VTFFHEGCRKKLEFWKKHSSTYPERGKRSPQKILIKNLGLNVQEKSKGESRNLAKAQAGMVANSNAGKFAQGAFNIRKKDGNFDLELPSTMFYGKEKRRNSLLNDFRNDKGTAKLPGM